ncbi:MAG: RNase H family protein [Chloroflexota bacterium]
MSYKYETQLCTKAQAFADAIQSELSYSAIIDPKSFREYSVAVQLGEVGSATIYYSPKKDTYKLVPNNLGDAVTETISSVWQSLPDTAVTSKKASVAPSKPRTQHQAYVDGSYDESRETVGYGAVILSGDTVLARLSGSVDDFAESRQIGGELQATMEVIKYCQENDITKIDIYYDYKGIELWATGKWKANKPLTQSYRAFMQNHRIKVHWHKVKSHTGVKWNEVADDLAKKGTRS